MRRTCALEHVGLVQLAGFGQAQQFVVGNAAPQEKRQPRSQFEIANPIGLARFDALRIALHAEQELRADQHRRQRHLDAGFKALRRVDGLAIELQRPLEVRARRRDGGRRAASAFDRISRAQASPSFSPFGAGRRRCAGGWGYRPGPALERTDDRDLVDRRLDARVAVEIEVRLVGLALGLEQRGRLLEEGHADLVRPGGDSILARGQVIVAEACRFLSRRLDGEQADPLAVEQQLDLVRLRAALRPARCGRGPGGSGSRTRRPPGTCRESARRRACPAAARRCASPASGPAECGTCRRRASGRRGRPPAG